MSDSVFLFSLDVAEADAAAEGKRLADWLVRRGWATPLMTPGPRALETGALFNGRGGALTVHAEPRLNMQGADMEGPTCPYCGTQKDIDWWLEEYDDDDPYPVLQCEGCGKDVAYRDWVGTAHPIASNLTLELDDWDIQSDSPSAPPLLAEIREEMGGTWVFMWSHT